MATPILRDALDAKKGQPFTEEEATKLVQQCLEVLYYRDARSWDRYHIATVNDKGSRVDGPFRLKTNWQFATMVTGYE